MNRPKKQKNRGFTIVELLIVIVIIAILAAISVVAYTGIQTRAETTAKTQAMTNWAKLFSAYKALNAEWPSAMAQGEFYCLGTGFPSSSFSGNVPRCRDYHSTSTGYLESDATALMTQLKTISSSLPDNPKKPTNSAVVGPYAYRSSSNAYIRVIDVFPPSSTACPDGTTDDFYDANTARWCRIELKT
jgi:prepilin-type N-terminal cleavage/methylation domain-containing protein